MAIFFSFSCFIRRTYPPMEKRNYQKKLLDNQYKTICNFPYLHSDFVIFQKNSYQFIHNTIKVK